MKNQNGFSAVVVLLILILISVVSFAGWYVYSSQQNNKNSSDNSESKTSSNNQSVNQNNKDSQKYLVIKEWGVKIALSGINSSLEAVVAAGAEENVEIYNLQNSTLGEKCQNLGSIARTSSSTYTTLDGTTKNGKKVGDYYYYHFDIQNMEESCTDQQSKAISEVKNSIAKITTTN